MTNTIICCAFAVAGILGQIIMGAVPAIMMSV
jgi:hypothetical protein